MNETKKHILKVTFGLFLQKNFKEVTMKEIVERTGLSKGAFYHYFESKEKLFEEVIGYFYQYMLTNNPSDNPAVTLQEYYKGSMNQFAGVDEFFSDSTKQVDKSGFFDINFFSLMFDALKIIPGFQEKIRLYHIQELEQWTEVVARARRNGEIRTPMSDKHVAQLFLFSADGFALNRTLYGNKSEAQEELLRMWDDFYAGIKA